MGAKGHAFKHEIDVASRTLGRDGRIRVVIGGTEAKTEADGVIRYPALADDVDLTDDQISLSRAYVDSETARVLHGDVAALRAAEAAWGEDSPAACAARSLEEIRLEAVRTREYLGCRANFQARARLEADLHGKDGSFADPSNLEAHALAVGRRDALGHDDAGLEGLAASLPADRRAAWADLCRKAMSTADTHGILRLAADAFGAEPPPDEVILQ